MKSKLLIIFFLLFFLKLSHTSFAQCKYTTTTESGVVLKQFAPMPIGGNNNKQIGVCVSNVNGDNLLMFTIRFRTSRSGLSNAVKVSFSDGKVVNLNAIAQKNDNVNGFVVTHLKFKLSGLTEKMFLTNNISSITLNGSEKISATMYQDYIKENLKCFL